MDASNMLKPLLARGELRLVGATTLDEYRQHIEKDPALERRFADPRYQAVGASLTEVGFTSPLVLFSTYAGSGADVHDWLKDATINTDRNLRLQYLAGLGLNQYTEAQIFTDIARFRRFPEKMFVADSAWVQQLRTSIGH